MSTAAPGPGPLQVTQAETADTVCIGLIGELDHSRAHLLLDTATRVLADRPDLRELRLKCAGITGVDPMGLSTLLMVRRRTDAAGIRLHLDDRPARLDRLMELTGTLEHLTDTAADADPADRKSVV